ncbi:antibiotic biosynthesis monooxygenase [Nucisporomicrobium flavum]|uniref:antibiotic biosynthesis monooxygenase n=1 Tax=Nucisporomicrobium flavum TaxID=2785915 RepID=UPI003C2AEF79
MLAKFEFLPGYEEEISRFFAEGRVIVEGQPASTGWYAARLGPSAYVAFAVFATEADRDALLAAGGPVLSKTYGHLFAVPPTFELADIVEHRAPAAFA